ncbi:MAG: ATP-grasp domain-containing protein [Chlamydiota bacterium]|nr:ATP-grasp domain-containing protein [Chlamydiota bacterium]
MIAVFYDATTGQPPIDPELRVALDISEDARLIQRSLQSLGEEVVLVELEDDVLKSLKHLQSLQPDLIFNLCEGYGEDSSMESRIAASLELLALRFTGAGSKSLTICHDKAFAKKIMQAFEIPTPTYVHIPVDHDIDTCPIPFPAIIKPVHEDGSLGIEEDAVVTNHHDFRDRVQRIHRIFQQPALVEAFIEGREINLSLLGNNPYEFVNIREVKFESGYRIVSFQGKWKKSSHAYQSTPVIDDVDLDQHLREKLNTLAKHCFKVFEMADYGRIDVRLDRSGTPFVIDVNPNPCISYGSGMALAAKEEGLDYAQFIKRIVDLAKQRTRYIARARSFA